MVHANKFRAKRLCKPDANEDAASPQSLGTDSTHVRATIEMLVGPGRDRPRFLNACAKCVKRQHAADSPPQKHKRQTCEESILKMAGLPARADLHGHHDIRGAIYI